MRYLLFTITLFLILPAVSIHAVYSSEKSQTYETGKTYTIELDALPQNNENAVKLNLVVTGARVEDFLVLNTSNWLFVTNDCKNEKKFTDSSICATFAKTSPLRQGESLGFIKLTVTNASKFSIYKVSGNQYSNGLDQREDLGEVINKIVIETNTNTTQNTSSTVNNTDPLLFYILIGIGVVVIILLISLVILAFKKTK